ncbi:MAG: carotenoid biosynthesis protein [Prolixibacteraceae bacterium]|nr:carotenoid biosynthesis protein [Prolixibacteraceae bacterium]
MSLYFIILLVTIFIPLLLSFDKRLKFYTRWKFVFPSLIFIAAIYIFFDIIFTNSGIWGFNSTHLSGIKLFGLPVEEVLFFIAIPYASIFLHEAFIEYFPNVRTGKKLTNTISFTLIIVSALIIIFNIEKTYTTYIFIKVIIVSLLSFLFNIQLIRSFYITFLIILVPFIIVNGVLTGTGINEEVVWYNNNENIGVRFLTIPVEDFGYAFSLILYNLITIHLLTNINWKNLKRKGIKLVEFLRVNQHVVFIFFIIFYLVGILGIITPGTHHFFQKLIPLALILSAVGLLIYHSKFYTQTYIIYVFVFSMAFIIEFIGVKTGAIFGHYEYGQSLGLKILNTPLIIGLNWLMLVYITSSIVGKITKQPFFQITTSALLMVGYDYVLEHVAPQLDMWYWQNDTIPLKNYIAWFILAIIFQILFRLFKLKTKNQLALFMFVCQTLFFLILWITL